MLDVLTGDDYESQYASLQEIVCNQRGHPRKRPSGYADGGLLHQELRAVAERTEIIQQTNELDTKTAADHRAIQDTDARAQAAIAAP